MVALLKMPMRIDSKSGADRRIFPRKEVHASVEGKRIDHTIEARRTPAFQLHLRDLSIGGLSALSPLPLDKGERLSMAIPALGMAGSWDACGKVLRCEPSAMGYRVAVEFDLQAAA
jgi:hypothetical protein